MKAKYSRNLKSLFGILSYTKGEDMLKDLEKIRQENIKTVKKNK